MGNYVIIPTYKESENLVELLPLLRKYNVIVVDDDSQDGTDRVCRRFKNVKLITRKNERGLASAVVVGIKSIREKDAAIVVADADFEHDYNRIKDVFDLLRENDFVECVKRGKRFWDRSIISESAKRLLYTLVPETKWLKDPMSGFFGFRLRSVDMEKVRPVGYKIMLEIYMNLKPKSKKTHIVYDYGYRRHGRSKLSCVVMLQFLEQVARLNRYRALIFTVIGAFGIFINEFLLYEFHIFMPLLNSLVYAIILSTLINFLMNHYITFSKRGKFAPSLVKFSAVTFVAGVINLIVAYYLAFIIMYLISNFIGIILSFIFKYALSENFVWNIKDGQEPI
ncbi:MAG: glycosyltransferase [Candidatus Micrarchaeaceae archaeon]